MPEEHVVAERERDAIAAHEIAPDQERLREPFRPRLLRVRDFQPELRAVAEQAAIGLLVLRIDTSRISRHPASISVVSG